MSNEGSKEIEILYRKRDSENEEEEVFSCNILTQKMTLSSRRISTIDLTPVSSLTRLRELDLSANFYQFDLSPLSSCSNLESLDLSNNDYKEIDLTPLSSLVNFRKLTLESNKIGSIDLSPLASCVNLEELVLTSNSLSSLNLTPLSNCRNLKTLRYGSQKLSEIDLSPLSNCKSLTRLRFGIGELSELDLEPLSNCHDLVELSFQKHKLESVDLSPLISCKKLETLEMSDNKFTHIDLEPLSSCTNLTNIHLNGNQIQEIDLTPLKLCRNLAKIDLGKNQISTIDLNPLQSLDIEVLLFSGNNLETIDLSPLSSLSNLQELAFSGSFQDIDLFPLSSCTKLQRLRIGGTKIRAIDLTPLASCYRLWRFQLDGKNLGEVDVTPLLATPLTSRHAKVDGRRVSLLNSGAFKHLGIHDAAFHQISSNPTNLKTLMTVISRARGFKRLFLFHQLLETLNLDGIGLLEEVPSDLEKKIAELDSVEEIRRRIHDLVVSAACEQIDRGGTTIGLDVEFMSSHGDLATRIPRVVELRKAEMKSAVIDISKESDLRPLLVTAYGFKVLSVINLERFNQRFDQIKEAFSSIGFDLPLVENPVKKSDILSSLSDEFVSFVTHMISLKRTKANLLIPYVQFGFLRGSK